MKISPFPENEKERLEVIQAYQILDTEEEQDFNDIVELAAELCNTPIAIITLIDQNRQWFKAKTGLDIKETSRDLSFCAHTIHLDDVMIVPDALQDERFFDNPLVTGQPYIRFYAGMPLIGREGFKLGSLAVIDQKPRALNDRQLKYLRMLAKQGVNLLDLRRSLTIQREFTTTIVTQVEEQTAEIKDILERVGDAFLSVDRNWNITFLNSKAAQITNRLPGEIIGTNLWKDFSEAFSSAFPVMAEKAMTTQQEQHWETYLAPYTRWVESNIYPSPKGLSIYFRDITARKVTEQLVKKGKELAESIISSLPGIFYLFNQEGVFLRWNKNFETISGYTSEEFATMHPLDFFDVNEKQLVADRIAEVFSNEHADVEANLLLKNQEKIPYYFNGWKIEYENQPCIIGVGIDITELTKAKKRLGDSENKLRAFFRSTPDANVLLGKNFEILAFNSAANQLAETTAGVCLEEGKAYLDLIFPESKPLISNYLDRALKGETSKAEFEVLNRQTGNTMWWLAVFMPAYNMSGEIFGVISNASNITEMKRSEIILKKQFEELQKTNHELDRFVYSVSHDLRAPLASILGLINVAELDQPSADQRNYLSMIRGRIDRLDGFIKDILDYSRNSRTEIRPQRIDFHELVEEVRYKLKLIEGTDRLQLDLEIEDEINFFSDRARLEIILSNLFSNAIKYQDYQKDQSFVSLQIRTLAEKVCIRFFDNGIGVEEIHLNNIFDMFYRASEKAKGSGIGLYIAKETVSKLNGMIQVQSEFGIYTTFQIEIPNLRAT